MVLVALVLGGLTGLEPAPVSAGEIVASWGKQGAWNLEDTIDDPGMMCFQGSPTPGMVAVNFSLDNLPTVYARDRTAGTDHQLVSYAHVILRWSTRKARWVRANDPKRASGVATDTRPATWNHYWVYPNTRGPVKSRIIIRWYGADTVTVVGSVVYAITFYGPWESSGGSVQEGQCEGVW